MKAIILRLREEAPSFLSEFEQCKGSALYSQEGGVEDLVSSGAYSLPPLISDEIGILDPSIDKFQ